MQIYIASSWKNQRAVELLTEALEARRYIVRSFIRKGGEDERVAAQRGKNVLPPGEYWMFPNYVEKFKYDVESATKSDVVIYISPSGTDAWAEVGAAYQAGVPILGLLAKGEQAGLMSIMVDEWITNYRELLSVLALLAGGHFSHEYMLKRRITYNGTEKD